MNLGEIIAAYRVEAFDNEVPPFCSDELLALYATEAQTEACRRGVILRDSVSPMCSLAFAADATHVVIAPQIVRILRARTGGHDVTTIDVEDMDASFPNWQDDASRGRPTHLVAGMTTGALHLWPRPADAGTLSLTVQRMPIKALVNDTDKPEIRQEAHQALVDWLIHKACSRQDGELFNAQKASAALDRFEKEFGRKSSLRNEEWVRSGVNTGPAPIA